MWGHRGGRGFAFGGEPGWRGRGRMFGSGEMKFVVLKLIAGKPMHGYEVMKALEERSRGAYRASPGTVYPTLQWLEDEGLVEMKVAGDNKKIYSITKAGEEFLEENRSHVEDIFERMEDMADYMAGGRMPEIGRESGRLMRQAFRTARRTRDDATLERLVEILERAREEIRDLGRESRAKEE